MKIGIDFHGVITDNLEFWLEMINMWRSFGIEVHLMTGARYETFLNKQVELGIKDIGYSHFFSISEFHAKHNPDKIDLSKPNNPYIADKELWDKTKAEYAMYHNLDLVIDDTAEYGKYFKTPFLLYKGKKGENK